MVVCLLVFGAMTGVTRALAADRAFVSGPLRGWVAAVSLSLVVWAAVFGWGVRALRRLDPAWRRERRWWAGHAAAYVILVGVVLGVLALNNANATLRVPVHGAATLTRILILFGAIAAAPWVAMVWLAHERVGEIRSGLETITSPEPTDALEPSMLDGPAIAGTTRWTLDVWSTIERCALALAVVVSMAVLDSGALRIALVGSGRLDPRLFPPLVVLLYGAFFAAVLLIAVLPLVLAWRALAVALVDRALGEPLCGVPGEAWLALRGRFESHLRVDATILRRPITALSLLSPLVLALVTAFVPRLS